MNQAKKARAVVTYSGDVQGVGFRITTVGLAQGTAITGWVQNQPNGDVLLDAEGELSQLKNFLQRIAGELGHRIADAQIEWRDPTGKHQSFQIRY